MSIILLFSSFSIAIIFTFYYSFVYLIFLKFFKFSLANTITILNNIATSDSNSHLPDIILMHILLDSTDIMFMIIKKIKICSSFLIIRGPWHAWCSRACLLKVEISEHGEITNVQREHGIRGVLHSQVMMSANFLQPPPYTQSPLLLGFLLHPFLFFLVSKQQDLTVWWNIPLIWLQALPLPTGSQWRNRESKSYTVKTWGWEAKLTGPFREGEPKYTDGK